MNNVIEHTLKQEEWKPIPGYEGLYEVSNYGRVKSYQLDSNGKILSPGNTGKDGSGYCFVNLYKDGKAKKHCTIHRLVAEAFIPNPSNFPQVNHKDECKKNNYFENLEWCSSAYNNSYGTRTRRMAEKNSKPVVQLDKKGNFISEFESLREASRRTGIADENICRCCNHKPGRYSAGGFIWIYKDEYLNTQTQQEK